jgi:hypothetical protein
VTLCCPAGKLQEPGQILDANDKESKGKDKKDFIIRCARVLMYYQGHVQLRS